MGKVFDQFVDLFVPPQGTEPAPEESEEEFKVEVRDVRQFAGTSAFTRYRNGLIARIEALVPDPAGGMDAAAAVAFQQSGLREALRILDAMVSVAAEDPDG